MSSEEQTDQSERRSEERFPIRLNLRYRVLSSHMQRPFAHGQTINMSSHGILFVDGQTLILGTKVEAEVDWPAQLDGQAPLKLIVRGSVVRFENRCVALALGAREFRTCTPQKALAIDSPLES